ncbi:hypothetical protein OMP38_29855 [Cohnella ginsengisoli]|uniref:Glycosyltransferase Maf N-terminal domain-containing protein n=1 Tax=Cohnella ginsengisoli TaxID=425004 RepID=A0A9X4KM96_9BACL|nr:hypothetical protein [Cohnella ginsengisoli]MDG0794576.1 hypothetical protein [Cohnella ginsengisoli]
MNGQHDQHLTEAIDEIRRFLPRLIDATKDLADQLYSSPNQHTWEELGEVVQAIDDLYKSLRSLEGQIEENSFFLPASTSDLSAFSSQLEVQFGVMNRSMDEENYVGAGDAFKHELVPLFERLSQMLGEEESVQSARFRDNLAYLEERFPFVFASVSQAAMSTSYRVCYAANGSANLNVQVNDGHSVHYYSEYDPQFEASKWSETVANDIGDKNNVILYGMGFGYHLAALASRKQGCHYYIFEPDMNVFFIRSSCGRPW